MISVSVCMIVKNEEAVLERCLDSLKGLWDELVIVDTGSTDKTKEIASKYTDLIYDLEWIDDFSYARNFAFSKCTKEYIYSVDADEVLDDKNRSLFLDLKNCILPEIEIVQMWYVNTNEFATTENFSKELRPKLYKRLREFKWIDPIHESVNLNPIVYDSDIEILHMPISNHAGRDFAVFQKAISNGTLLSDKLIKMYARELMIAGEEQDFIDAKDFFLYTAMNQETNEDSRLYSICVLAKTYRLLGNDAEFFKWSLKNIVTSSCSEICYELGCYYYDKNDFDEAIIWFINAANETSPVLNAAIAASAYMEISGCYNKMAEENEFLCDLYQEEAKKFLEMANELRQ